MRSSVVLLSCAICGGAIAGYEEAQQARTAIAYVRVAPTVCKSISVAPGAMSAILSKLTPEDSADVIGYEPRLILISKTVRGMMETGDEANACKMARDFEMKSGLKLFVP